MVSIADLPKHIRMMNAADIVSTIIAPTTDIDFFGEAKLAYSRSKEGKKLSTLTFMSSDDIPAKDIAFVVENQSRQRLICKYSFKSGPGRSFKNGPPRGA